MRPRPLIQGGIMRVESICSEFGQKEFLRPTLAPYGIRQVEDGIFLGWTGRLPLIDKIGI